MTEYGVFANLVGTVSSLVAAGAAMTIAFTKRTQWQPPEEAVPLAVSRMAGLVSMIGVALLYAFSTQMGSLWLAVVTGASFLIAMSSLLVAIRTNINHSYYFPSTRAESNRRLGGDTLTREAASIAKKRGLTQQQMFEDAQGDKDLVWTRQSQAAVHIRSTLSYILLIGAGACCIAAAGTLVGMSRAPSAPVAANSTNAA